MVRNWSGRVGEHRERKRLTVGLRSGVSVGQQSSDRERAWAKSLGREGEGKLRGRAENEKVSVGRWRRTLRLS